MFQAHINKHVKTGQVLIPSDNYKQDESLASLSSFCISILAEARKSDCP